MQRRRRPDRDHPGRASGADGQSPDGRRRRAGARAGCPHVPSRPWVAVRTRERRVTTSSPTRPGFRRSRPHPSRLGAALAVLAILVAACGGAATSTPGAVTPTAPATSGTPATPSPTRHQWSSPSGSATSPASSSPSSTSPTRPATTATRASRSRSRTRSTRSSSRSSPRVSFDMGIADGTSVIPAVSQGIPVQYVFTVYADFPSIVFAKASSGIVGPADLAGEEGRDPGQVRVVVDPAPGAPRGRGPDPGGRRDRALPGLRPAGRARAGRRRCRHGVRQQRARAHGAGRDAHRRAGAAAVGPAARQRPDRRPGRHSTARRPTRSGASSRRPGRRRRRSRRPAEADSRPPSSACPSWPTTGRPARGPGSHDRHLAERLHRRQRDRRRRPGGVGALDRLHERPARLAGRTVR